MKLYEIDARIVACVDNETGEVMDFDLLNALTMERSEKIEQIALAYKNSVAEAEALKAEKNSFAEREKRAKNRAEYLKGYLTYVLNGEKFKTTKVDISFRKSEAVVFEGDIFSLPDKYLTYKTPELNKTAIKQALKSGIELPGCAIESRLNIGIK